MENRKELKEITKEQLKIIRLDTVKTIFAKLNCFIEPAKGTALPTMNLFKFFKYQKQIKKEYKVD